MTDVNHFIVLLDIVNAQSVYLGLYATPRTTIGKT